MLPARERLHQTLDALRGRGLACAVEQLVEGGDCRHFRTGDVDLGSVETTYAAHNVEAGVAFRRF